MASSTTSTETAVFTPPSGFDPPQYIPKWLPSETAHLIYEEKEGRGFIVIRRLNVPDNPFWKVENWTRNKNNYVENLRGEATRSTETTRTHILKIAEEIRDNGHPRQYTY